MADQVTNSASKRPSGGGLRMPGPGESARLLQQMVTDQAQQPVAPPDSLERELAPPADTKTREERNLASLQESKKASNEDFKPNSGPQVDSRGAPSPAGVAATPTARKQESKRAREQESNLTPLLSSHIESKVAQLQATPLAPLNLRIPEAFNHWLDEQVFKRKRGPAKTTKQGLLIEAIALLIAREEQAAQADGNGEGE
jgi:hypothetical protein